MHHARFIAVELHKHVVPNFDKAVTIFIWATRRATPVLVTVVVKNFGTWAARACVTHHPEVV